MRYFRYNHLWFVPYTICQFLILFYIYSYEKQELINFYMGYGGDKSTTFVAIMLFFIIFFMFMYMPYRIITDPRKSYRFDENYLYIDSKSSCEKIKLGAMTETLIKPKWTRLLAAPYIITYVKGEEIKIPSGFYLSGEDYEYFKSRVVVKEQ